MRAARGVVSEGERGLAGAGGVWRKGRAYSATGSSGQRAGRKRAPIGLNLKVAAVAAIDADAGDGQWIVAAVEKRDGQSGACRAHGLRWKA